MNIFYLLFGIALVNYTYLSQKQIMNIRKKNPLIKHNSSYKNP